MADSVSRMRNRVTSLLKRAYAHLRREKSAYLLMLLAVVVSVSLRLPTIWSESPRNANWLHAVMMRHADIFREEPTFRNLFAPPLTYPGDANGFIDNNSANESGRTGFMSSDGSYYYLSYPPFSFMLAEVFFFFVRVDLTLLNMGLFAMSVQVLTAFVLFAFARDLTRSSAWGVVAFVLYMFIGPSAVWHMSMYFSDTVIQPLFALAGYLLYKALGAPSRKFTWLYAAVVFFAAYTDWLGYICAASIGLYILFSGRYRILRGMFWASVIAPTAALVVTLAQYASVIGFSRFVSIFIDKYVNSYAYGDTSLLNAHKFSNILDHYSMVAPLLWMLLACAVTIALSWFLARRNRQEVSGEIGWSNAATVAPVFFGLGLPFVVHHVVFFHWTSHVPHGFSVLKSLPFIILLFVLLGRILWGCFLGRNSWVRLSFALGLSMIFLVWGNYMLFGNWFAQRAPEGYETSFCDVGREMGERAGNDAVIFLMDERAPGKRHWFPINPIPVFCSKRNMAVYEGREKALELMKRNGSSEGVVFSLAYFDQEGLSIVKETRFSVPK